MLTYKITEPFGPLTKMRVVKYWRDRTESEPRMLKTFFFFFITEYNCFTMLCYFLLSNEVNLPYGNIYALPH